MRRIELHVRDWHKYYFEFFSIIDTCSAKAKSSIPPSTILLRAPRGFWLSDFDKTLGIGSEGKKGKEDIATGRCGSVDGRSGAVLIVRGLEGAVVTSSMWPSCGFLI